MRRRQPAAIRCGFPRGGVGEPEHFELGLFDADGDLVAYKTFLPKGKDDDMEFIFDMDEIFWRRGDGEFSDYRKAAVCGYHGADHGSGQSCAGHVQPAVSDPAGQ